MSGTGNLAAILLAAGGSSRLGRSKQLLEFGGESLVRRGAGLLAGLGLEVAVVTGADQEAVVRELRGLPVSAVHNARWREGIGSSISVGVASLAASAPAVLILLVDQYAVQANDLDNLIVAWRAEPGRIIASRWNESFGAPAVFPADYFDQLRELTGDAGAKALLQRHRGSVRFVELPNAARDVDEASDLAVMSRGQS